MALFLTTLVNTASAWPTATAVIGIVMALLAMMYAFFTHRFSYWNRQGISGPPPSIPFGNAVKPKGVGFHEADMDNIKRYGRVHGYYFGLQPVLMIADPDLLRDVLVKDFAAFADRQHCHHRIEKQNVIMQNGKRWKEQRNIISPTFTSGKMKAMHHLIKQSIDRMTDFMDQHLARASGTQFEADFDNKDLFSKLTLTVIARCGFATEINAFSADDNAFVNCARDTFKIPILKILLDMALPTVVELA